ncbi:hypothetical protein ABPG74_011486 [Tetrahymena malaccensis]
MSEFFQTQDDEVKNLTAKVQNHFSKNIYQGRHKNKYQKLLENKMLSQEYNLKDSCNIFSKKQIDEQFFITLPDLKQIYENEQKIISQWEQIVKDKQHEQKKQSENNSKERIHTMISNFENQEGDISKKLRRSSTLALLNAERRDMQHENNHIEFDQLNSNYFRRSSIDKNSNFFAKSALQSKVKNNYGVMPTYSDYQKLKQNSLQGFETFQTNFYSTFYETPKLSEKEQPFKRNKTQKFAQTTRIQEEQKNIENKQIVTFPKQQRKGDQKSNLLKEQNESVDFKQSSFYNESNGFQKNKTSNYDQSQLSFSNMKEIQLIKQTLNKQQNTQQLPNQNKLKEDFKKKFDKFKFINKIDLEMGVNYTFEEHMERICKDKDTLLNFQNHINNVQFVQQNVSPNQNNQNNNQFDSKINISMNSKHISSQIQSKVQFNSKINVSKTNALSSSQISVKDGILHSIRKKREEGNYSSQPSQTTNHQLAHKTVSTPAAIIEVPNNLFMKNSTKRQSILSLQQSQSVVQNFNFPFQFLTSLSREESTKINTVQSFFPDFTNNLRFLEKQLKIIIFNNNTIKFQKRYKQTKKRAARALKKILGWNEKMAPLILTEDGTEIKKDLDFQTAFFEEVIKNQKQNSLRDASQNKKDVGNKLNSSGNPNIITLSFDAIWESFQKYQYLNKNLIEVLERKEKELFKQYRSSLLEEIVDIHKMQSQQLNKYPLSNKQYQVLVTLPRNISYILDRKNYLQKEQALDNLVMSEINLGQFPFLLQFDRIRSKYINLSNQVIRNYEKHV